MRGARSLVLMPSRVRRAGRFEHPGPSADHQPVSENGSVSFIPEGGSVTLVDMSAKSQEQTNRCLSADLPAQHEKAHSTIRLAESRRRVSATTAFLYAKTAALVSGRASFRRHQLDGAPVCAIHRLDVRGTAAVLREISPVATCHPPRHRSTGQSYGRCRPIFGWSVPYRDYSIRPHDSLKLKGWENVSRSSNAADSSIQWNEGTV